MRLVSYCIMAAAMVRPLAAQGPGRVPLDHMTLPNGLDVVLAPDSSTQIVAVDLWVRAGSRYDPSGRGGLAHLFARLAFAGSGHVTRGEHEQLVENARGQFGADVEEEMVRLTETVPAERLNLALWLEAERLRGLRLDDSAFALARSAELQDQAGSTEAFSSAILAAVTGLYDSTGCYSYGHLVRGTPGELAAANVGDAVEFFRRFYTTGNARLVVAGAFDPAEARRLVSEYFGDIPAGPAATPPPCTAGSVAPRTLSLTEPRSAVPAAGVFYRIPGHDHADTPALELLGVLFGQGRGSRLNTALRGPQPVAVATQAGVFATRKDTGVFALFAVAMPGVTADSMAGLLAAEAAWAQGPGVTQADLDRAKNIYLATVVSARQRPQEIAESIQHAALFHGSADAVNAEFERYAAVTLEDLRRVARAWLVPTNALTLEVAAGGAS
jgi:zinc protease